MHQLHLASYESKRSVKLHSLIKGTKGLTAETAFHHGSCTYRVGDSRKTIWTRCRDPFFPVGIGAILPIVGHLGQAGNSLSCRQFAAGCRKINRLCLLVAHYLNRVTHSSGEVLKIRLDNRAPAICTVKSHATLKKFTKTSGFVNGLVLWMQVISRIV